MDKNLENTSELILKAKQSSGRSRTLYAVIAIVAVAIIAGVVGHFVLADKKYDDQVALAEKTFLEGNYEQAEVEYAAAVAMNPRKTKAREGLAYVKAVNGKYDEAKSIYDDLYEETKDEKYDNAAKEVEDEKIPSDGDLIPAPGVVRPIVVSGTPEYDALRDFLGRFFAFSYDNYSVLEYDSADPGNSTIMDSLMGDYIMDFSIYPGGEGDSAWNNSEPDPRGWAKKWESIYIYICRNADCVDWVAENILNISDEDYEMLIKRGEEEHAYYKDGDDYYFTAGARTGIGAFGISITDVWTDGTKYYIAYDGGFADLSNYTSGSEAFAPEVDRSQDYEKFYAVMELKTIDGRKYWSLYRHGTEMPEELALALEGGSDKDDQADGTKPGDGAAVFGQLKNVMFVFASGAGGWSTELYVNPDGTFTGYFHDSDMGDTGDGYPNGTLYECNFHGTFVEAEQVDEYTYRFRLGELVNEDERGREYIKDGVRHIVSYPYGVEGADVFELYLPGKPTDELSDEFLTWMYGVAFEEEYKPVMKIYGLYDINGEQGFGGFVN